MKTLTAAVIFGLITSGFNFGQQAPAQPAPEWGTILGRVIYDGKGKIPAPRMVPITKIVAPGQPAEIDDQSLVINKQNSGLANVFVYLRSKPIKLHPAYIDAPAEKQTFTINSLRFEPHAQIIWTNDDLELVNVDPRNGHAVKFQSFLEGFNELLPVGGRVTKRFKVEMNMPQPTSSNIYPWMQSNYLVRDNPYFCVTDGRGIFCIPNLPTNEVLEFVFWHERVGFLKNIKSDVGTFTTNEKGRLQTKLTQPVTDFGEFRIDPKLFEVPR